MPVNHFTLHSEDKKHIQVFHRATLLKYCIFLLQNSKKEWHITMQKTGRKKKENVFVQVILPIEKFPVIPMDTTETEKI